MKKIFIIILLLIPILSFAAEKPAPNKSLQEQVWIETEGEAVMGEYDTKKEIMERAKRDAQNKALGGERGRCPKLSLFLLILHPPRRNSSNIA